MEFLKKLQAANQAYLDGVNIRIEAETARDKLKREKSELLAREAIENMEKTCLEKAADGRHSAQIYRVLPYGCSDRIADCRRQTDRKCTYADLMPHAQAVYNHATKMLGLTVELQWDHDGAGIIDWYNMIASWPKEDTTIH